MSEVQEAADLITASVAPDANIIFGATLKPEMEDELVITVIATGFDSAYYNDDIETPVLDTTEEVEKPAVEPDVTEIDLDLDKDEREQIKADFANDDESNIWVTPDDDESDTPAFLRRRNKKK
jgi:cell division protein FtsZ